MATKKKKTTTVKILSLQIKDNNTIFGLGNDNKVYIWDYHVGVFKIYAKDN